MAVVVVILLLTGILVTVIGRSQRAAQNARAKSDLAAIAQALDAYANDFKGLYPMSRDPNTGRPVPGEHLLAKALIGPGPKSEDGFGDLTVNLEGNVSQNAGFRTVPGGSPHLPYLDPGKFKPVLINNQWEILDPFGTPIAYLPRRIPNRTVGTPFFSATGNGMFYYGDILGLKDGIRTDDMTWTGEVDSSRVAAVMTCVAIALGDNDGNGALGPNETLRFTGPFVLISAGPERKFWSNPANIKKNDNVYNFDR